MRFHFRLRVVERGSIPISMSTSLLVIEDDPYVQRFYERLFRLNKYSVVLASGGSDGITQAKLLKPSLILLDIMMPGMDGIQVLQALKADPETKDISVVMLTNFGEESMMKKAVGLGAIDFIIKSQVSGDALLAIVDNYIQKQA